MEGKGMGEGEGILFSFHIGIGHIASFIFQLVGNGTEGIFVGCALVSATPNGFC